MATNLVQIVRELTSFYDVTDKKVVVIGAGEGQLVEYVRPARQVIAVDKDAGSLERLAARLRDSGLADRFTLVTSDLLEVREHGDVVYFEFCLHQMSDPERALDVVGGIAPDLLLIDHAPDSPWSWCAAEDRLVKRAWHAVEGLRIRRQHAVAAEQRFLDYTALEARMAAQGSLAQERIGSYLGRAPVVIPMPYRLALSEPPSSRQLSFRGGSLDHTGDRFRLSRSAIAARRWRPRAS